MLSFQDSIAGYFVQASPGVSPQPGRFFFQIRTLLPSPVGSGSFTQKGSMFSGVSSSCKKQAFAGRSQYIWEERFQLISKYTGTVGDLITSTSLVKCPKMNSLDFC